MFGKGGGPLNAWLKEFCELVFIQTLQAFIFAIIVSFIVNLSTANILETNDRNLSYGIICIVAFTSIFKVEEILRKIFGYGPTKADHGNAVQSIGKSMMAFKMGKNLLDNGKKIVGGASAIAGARNEKKKYINKQMKRMDAWKKDNGIDDEAETKTSLPVGADKNNATVVANKSSSAANKTSNSTQPRKIDSAKRDRKIQLMEDAQHIRKDLIPNEKDEAKRKALIAEAKRKLDEAKGIDDTLVEPKPENKSKSFKITISGDDSVSGLNISMMEDDSPNSSAKTSANSNSSDKKSGGGKPKDYYQKTLQMQEDYDDKMKELKKKKRQGWKQIASGVAESGAALVGFTAGTAMSAASTNDWGSAVKDGITWAGTADALTAGAVDLTFGAGEFLADFKDDMTKTVEEYNKNFDIEYNKAAKQAEKEVQEGQKTITQAAQQSIDQKNAAAAKAANSSRSKSTSRSASKPKISKAKVAGAAAIRTVSIKPLENEFKAALKQANSNNDMGKVVDTDRNVLK